MLKIAIPNKGALSEGAVSLMREAGYRCKRSGRELSVLDRENEVEFIYLRPRDIAIYVGNGTLDLGITGRDLAMDSQSPVSELLGLGFGRSRFFYAVPRDSGLTPDGLDGKRIATSYPAIVRQDLERRGITAEVIRLDGAVEISIRLGVADAIADVVESGLTLKEAGLATVGEPIMQSEAMVIDHGDRRSAEKPETQRLLNRLRGILVARDYAMVEYDISAEKLDAAAALTPGLEAPTVSPLSREGWMAVKSVIKRKDINRIMDELAEAGARGIIVSDMRSCRL